MKEKTVSERLEEIIARAEQLAKDSRELKEQAFHSISDIGHGNYIMNKKSGEFTGD